MIEQQKTTESETKDPFRSFDVDYQRATKAVDTCDMTPQVRVVDKDTGKVAYFYTPQQVEFWLREQERSKNLTVFQGLRRGQHPLAMGGVMGSSGQHTATHFNRA